MAGKRTIHAPGIRIIWDDGATGVMLHSAKGEVGQDVQRRAYAVQKRMKRAAPVWSGELQRGIHVLSVNEGPKGPFSKVISDAPHTLVIELGRGTVEASGLVGPSQRRTRGKSRQLSKSNLTWGSDRTGGNPTVLTIRLTPGGAVWLRPRARGTKKGAGFMSNSVDAAVD